MRRPLAEFRVWIRGTPRLASWVRRMRCGVWKRWVQDVFTWRAWTEVLDEGRKLSAGLKRQLWALLRCGAAGTSRGPDTRPSSPLPQAQAVS